MILATHGIIQSQALAGYNPLTTAWIAETGESDQTIIDALNALEQGLIDNSLISKMNAIYPFVGGSATTHKYNFMDARDLDVAFRLEFNGGWTHSATGALPNGTNAYADTHINIENDMLKNSLHFSYYSRNNVAINGWAIGVNDATNYVQMIIRSGGDSIFGRINSNGAYHNATVTDSRGLFTFSRTTSNAVEGYKNASSLSVTNATDLSVNKPNANIYTAARNSNGTPTEYDAHEAAFISFGEGLTAGEVSTLYTIVQTFQTSLNRNV